MNGILPVYKERGMTSHDVVFKLRKILNTKKIGHSGTLDPNVDGVLPVAIGRATKVVDYLMASGKVYRGSITLGFATTTEDLDGEEVERIRLNAPFTNEQINNALAQLTGVITQIPPMYSAVKVNGKKLYEYARAGEAVTRPSRQVTVSNFRQIKEATWDATAKTQTIYFKVAASKGTYVRTLAVDCGCILGVPAVMSSLTRFKSGGFEIKEALKLSEIQTLVTNNELTSHLRPIDYPLMQYSLVDVNNDLWERLKNGGWFTKNELNIDADVIRMRYQNETKALYQWDDQKKVYKPLKMFSNQ